MIEKTRKMLSDVAYDALKEKIKTLSAGEHISARKFAREVGLSYTPVREACIRMEQEGILRLVPNVGFFVETIDFVELVQIFQVRECLEGFVLEKVFSQITKDHISQMKGINAEQIQALSEGNIIEFQRLDIKFHSIIFRLYGNNLLEEFYKNIRNKYTLVSSKIANYLSDEANVEHLEYFKYLEEGKKEKAIAELKKHIQNAQERMMEGYIKVLKGDI